MKSLIPIVLAFSMFGCANQTKIDPSVDLKNDVAAIRKDVQVSLTQQQQLTQAVGAIKQQNNGMFAGSGVYALATCGLFVLGLAGVAAIWIHSRALGRARKAASARS